MIYSWFTAASSVRLQSSVSSTKRPARILCCWWWGINRTLNYNAVCEYAAKAIQELHEVLKLQQLHICELRGHLDSNYYGNRLSRIIHIVLAVVCQCFGRTFCFHLCLLLSSLHTESYKAHRWHYDAVPLRLVFFNHSGHLINECI